MGYDYTMLAGDCNALARRYKFCDLFSIGESVMEKKLYCIKAGNGQKKLFVNGAHHGLEYLTAAFIIRFLNEYCSTYVSSERFFGYDTEKLFSKVTLFAVPMVNPDGVDLVNGLLESGRFYREARRIASTYPKIAFPQGWKANIRGVDLNLQFPAGWEEAKRIKFALGFDRPAPRDYVGPMPLSEPESVAMYQFTKMHDFALILAYHTQGEVIYWRYLNYEPEKSYVIAQYFTRVSGYAVEETPSDSGYAGYKDWFIQEYDRPGYTIEAGKGINPLPMDQFDQIYRDNVGILLGGMTELE